MEAVTCATASCKWVSFRKCSLHSTTSKIRSCDDRKCSILLSKKFCESFSIVQQYLLWKFPQNFLTAPGGQFPISTPLKSFTIFLRSLLQYHLTKTISECVSKQIKGKTINYYNKAASLDMWKIKAKIACGE